MGAAFISAWKTQQQAAYFGTTSFAETVSVWTGDADPDNATPVSTEAIIIRKGEQPFQGDMDRSVLSGQAVLNKADVTLTRGTAGHYGFITDTESVRWAMVRKIRENTAFYHVELERIETDRTGKGREKRA